MKPEESIKNKAEHLIDSDLKDYIEEQGDYTENAILMIEDKLSGYDFKSHKILFLDHLIPGLESYKSNHIDVCKEKRPCNAEKNYNKVIGFCKKTRKQYVLDQSMITFEDKVLLIFQELAGRPDRRGELENILKENDIPFIESDLMEFIKYFNETGFVNTQAISKDGMTIILNQSGLDYLRDHLSKSSSNSLVENPRKNESMHMNSTRVNSDNSDPPTKTMQIISVVVKIILGIAALLLTYYIYTQTR